MIWAVLVLVGVPIWLCALGITALVFRARALRKRPGNFPVRVLRPGSRRWTRGQAVWVSTVFAWRGSPAAWTEDLVPVVALRVRALESAERKKLHRLGEDPAVAVLSAGDGETLTVATPNEHGVTLLGPFATEHTSAHASARRPDPPARPAG